MGLIQTLIARHQEKVQERNKLCDDWIARINDALFSAESIFSAPQAFIDPSAETNWKKQTKPF